LSRKNRNRHQQRPQAQHNVVAPAPGAIQSERPQDPGERIIIPNMREIIMNAAQQNAAIANGFGEAIGFSGGPGIGGGLNPAGFAGGFPGVPAISDTTTAFENLRWFLVSNFRQLLSQLYVEIGLVKTICVVPVMDGLRGGVTFKSKQMDEQQLIDLKIEMDKKDDINTAGWGSVWQRLYGGGGILTLVDDQDPEDELDLDNIKEGDEVGFRAVDMWELYWDKQNVEGYDAEITREDFQFYNYYSEQVHKSRVMRLKGLEAPSFIRPRLRGWGVSEVETLIRSMNQYIKATDLGFDVLDEFKLDVYKIKNLVNTLLSPNGTQAIQQRVQLANWQKNYQHAVVMDSEDDFDHKQLSFSGLAEAMQGIRMQVASDMRIPAIKLFGQSFSSGGLGTSSVEEMENYNAMVESEVRNKLKWHLLRMGEIRCRQMFGMIPDDLEIEFKPLRELSAIDQETVKTQKFTRLAQAKASGDLTTQEYRDAANKGQLFDVQLDTIEDGLNPNDPEIEEVASGERSQSMQVGDDNDAEEDDGGKDDEDGANKSDTAKVAPKLTAVRNEILQFNAFDSLKRFFNSAEFDKASYEADGGDDWIATGRKELFGIDEAMDKSLYAKCQGEAEKLGLGWKFTVWLYKKQGGKFQ
jgi:phage-related protein (TIGR01555 family)